MKVEDLVFELRLNYVEEDVIEHLVELVRRDGFNEAIINSKLEKFGYDAIFDSEEDFYETETNIKIQHRKHLQESE